MTGWAKHKRNEKFAYTNQSWHKNPKNNCSNPRPKSEHSQKYKKLLFSQKLIRWPKNC